MRLEVGDAEERLSSRARVRAPLVAGREQIGDAGHGEGVVPAAGQVITVQRPDAAVAGRERAPAEAIERERFAAGLVDFLLRDIQAHGAR